jgi:hypothetical protein
VVGTIRFHNNLHVEAFMPSYESSVYTKYWLEHKDVPSVQPVLYEGTTVSSKVLDEGKISVDSGKFIPGIYRTNPYKVWKEEVMVAEVSHYVRRTDLNTTWNYCFKQTGNPCLVGLSLLADKTMPSAMTDLSDRALQTAYGRVRQADLSLGESIGELRETLQTIRNPLSALREFLSQNSFKHLHNLIKLQKQAKLAKLGKLSVQGLKDASDTWLELRYGLRPLVITIRDVMEMVAETGRKEFNPSTIRRARAKKKRETKTSLPTFISGESYFGYQLTPTRVDELTAYASVQYRQEYALTSAEKFGLSPEFLPEIAWELTRLSFVVDWLFTIGPWLASYRIKPGITILGNTVGKKIRRKVTVGTQWRVQQSPYMDWSPLKSNQLYWNYEEYSRVVNQSLPLLPQFTGGDVIDLYKTIDSLALILQPILKRLK